jgi:tryptophanyl-tRNA synthetase
MKKVLVSGIKPTGEIHFGNYFGAMKQNIDMANSGDFEAYIFVANYHALTTSNNNVMAEELREDVYKMVASYIALGFDITKANLFLQSSVPAHTELSTVFNNLVSMPYMMRAHAFKDHEAKSKDVNVGLFTYPILMAADILIYDADIVPVGADQKQHIEYARDIAGYFNRAYQKEYFKLPEDFILDSVAIVPGIDGNKMSKSKNNHIPVFCDEEEIKKRVMSIVTDSLKSADKKDPETNNVYNIHKHFLNKEEDEMLRNKFLNASLEAPYGHAESKKDLIETILKFREGKYEKYLELMNDKEKLKEILEMGAKNARLVADKTIKEVRNIVGLEL